MCSLPSGHCPKVSPAHAGTIVRTSTCTEHVLHVDMLMTDGLAEVDVLRALCSYYPALIGGLGIVFDRFLCSFIYLFVSLSARLRENGWTDLHEICREGVE